jgi:hypothetical protein
MSRPFAAFTCVVLAFVVSCTSSGGGVGENVPAAPAEVTAPVTVMAVVDKIERNALQDFITDGTVVNWTVVTLTVIDPREVRGSEVQAYSAGHPYIGEAPLLVGQRITFVLPPPATRVSVPFEDLRQLQRSR